MSMPSRSLASCAVRQMRTHMSASRPSTVAEPTKPSSSPTAVKMKSVCCSGTNPRRVCVPSNRPLPLTLPEAMAALDWSELYAAGLDVGLLLAEEVGEPVALVVLEDVGVEDAHDADDADRAEHHDVARPGPRHQQHAHGDGDEHERRPEVGLQHDQRDGQGQHGERQPPAGAPSAARPTTPAGRPPPGWPTPWPARRAATGTPRAGTTPACPVARCPAERPRGPAGPSSARTAATRSRAGAGSRPA